MAKNVLIVVALIALGVLVFCLCCYKVTNLLYQLFTIDSQDRTEMVSPLDLEKKLEKNIQRAPSDHLQNTDKSGLPPEYRDVADATPSLPLHITPRCSRHSAVTHPTNGLDSQTGKNHGAFRSNSKEELTLTTLNHFPSAGELREPDLGFTSVERLLPPYPSNTPQSRTHRHRESNGAARGQLDNHHPSYSYSYTNIHCARDSSNTSRSDCCPAASNHHPPPQQHHHIATMRRTPVQGHHGEHPRWCNNGSDFHHSHHHLPHNSDRSFNNKRYQCVPPFHPYSRQHSRDSLERDSDREREDDRGGSAIRSLEDREVSAMFHRDTLLARIVRL